MSSIFAAISGHLTRSLVLGTLLPVVVFVITGVTIFSPLLPQDLPLAAPLRAVDKDWVPWVLVLITLAITGLLFNLNTPLIRLYEGYVWNESRVGRWRTRYYRQRVERATLSKTRLILMRSALSDPAMKGARAEVQSELSNVARELNTFPGADLVLPTRFGNVIRSFEEYPRTQYGMSTITLWPRMAAGVNKEYAALIDDSKGSMDFALNCSFLCSVLAGGLFATGVLRRAALFHAPHQILPWVLTISAFVLLAYFMYLNAITRAADWGTYVKGAFDLYRRDLLKQLGYEQQPDTIAAERELWKQVSRQILFGDPLDGSPVPFKVPASPGHKGGLLGWIDRWLP
jgi:hypothetical protein